jgi:Fe-S-cluster-containing hydrogenase component 2
MRQFHKPPEAVPGKQLTPGTVKVLRTHEGRCGDIIMDVGTAAGTCINCPDTPCVFFNESEVTSPVLTSLPYDRRREVCAFDALSVDRAQAIPIINANTCIGCGLCIARCPANALYSNNGVAVLNNAENAILKRQMPRAQKAYDDAVKRLRGGSWEGSIRKIDEETIADVVEAIINAGLSNAKQKLFVRNVLMCLGAEAAISTVGDTNLRIDMWWEAQGILWVTEVDFDEVSLIESPRSLLDDVAVCVSRHKVPRKSIAAAIICKEFPNKRTDFYHLIDDFEKVADLRIRTISVAGLLVLLWAHRSIEDIDILKNCNATEGNETIVAAFSKLVPEQVLWNRYFMATK